MMKLGKLLAAGKSFFGGRGMAAYRENKHVYLPKFNAQRNLFAPTNTTLPPAPAAPATPAVTSPGPVAAPAAASSMAKRMAPASAVRSSSPAKPSGLAAWTGKLNPFRPAPVVEAPALRGVQTELSLNTVKVIHNDLADADIENVPARSRTVDSSATPALSPARSNGMEFLSGRAGNLKTA